MRKIMRLLAMLLLSAMILGSTQPVPAGVPWREKVDPWVLDTATRQGTAEFLVFLTEQADLTAAARLGTKLEKGTYVFQQLTAVADRTQRPLLAALETMGVEHRPYWVANMIWVRGDLQVVQAMASRADVAHIYANPWVRLEEPDVQPGPSMRSPEVVEWNINLVGAPAVWAQGYTGQGAVIAGQDTGYDWDHPALINQYRGWDGSSADHNYNWHDAIHSGVGDCPPNSPEPCDDHNHGTHTMGTMVGDDGAGNQIGMAPGARWIGCRNMNEGVGSPATYAECYQWFIAPTDLNDQNPDPAMAPHVINNSWSCPPSEGCTDPNVLLTVVQNVRAAGILTAHSAGNSGSGCSTVDEPAAIYGESFTVGATSSSDTIASFSSRGPVTVDGSNRLKPDISAPGVSIRSSVRGGGYQGGWSGTSMAAPHVAGLVGLLISAQPALAGQVDTLENLIEATALPRTTTQTCGGVPGSQIPNNTYGWGRIQAFEAFQSLTHDFTIAKNAAPDPVAPGQALTYTLTITHAHPLSPTANVVITDTIPAGTAFITATLPHSFDGSEVRWDLSAMDPGEVVSLSLAVQVPLTATGALVNEAYGVTSDDAGVVRGAPVVTLIVPPSLALWKAAPVTARPGDVLTYTLTVTNPHPTLTLHNIVLTDTLPVGVSFLNATAPYSLTGRVVRWAWADQAPGESRDFELAVQIPLTATSPVVNLDYGVVADEGPFVAGGLVTTTLTVPGVALSPGQSVWALPGEALTFTHRLTNTGSVSDTFDVALASVQGWAAVSPLSVTLASGETTQVQVTVGVPQDAGGGVVETITLTATSQQNPLVSAQAVDEVWVLYRALLPAVRRP